jgi:hypothetical protein
MLRTFCFILLSLLLVSCAGSEKVHKFNDDTYLRAKSIPPIKVPKNLASNAYIEPYYPAPSGEYPEPGAEPISLLPPGMGDLIE